MCLAQPLLLLMDRSRVRTHPPPSPCQVLDAYTASFNFHDLRFDAAIRLFLESFRLPGEAQKIDRIINSFGNHFYRANPGIFRGPDAAYVLAYSVIMLNTDRHNTQARAPVPLAVPSVCRVHVCMLPHSCAHTSRTNTHICVRGAHVNASTQQDAHLSHM